MKRPDLDWSYLLGGLGLPAGLAGGALAALAASAWLATGAGSALEAREQELAALDAERATLVARLEARRRYARDFRELEAAGVIGTEQRLAWAAAFREAAASLHLPYLRYAALPQRALDDPVLAETVMVPVAFTPVDLQVGLVHELDLLRLVAELRRAPGLLEVAGCSLERAEPNAGPAPNRANLTGSCRLHWYSIAPPAAAMAEGGT
jgi:hypothetical protein